MTERKNDIVPALILYNALYAEKAEVGEKVARRAFVMAIREHLNGGATLVDVAGVANMMYCQLNFPTGNIRSWKDRELVDNLVFTADLGYYIKKVEEGDESAQKFIDTTVKDFTAYYEKHKVILEPKS